MLIKHAVTPVNSFYFFYYIFYNNTTQTPVKSTGACRFSYNILVSHTKYRFRLYFMELIVLNVLNI